MAFEKNKKALKNLLGNDELSALITSSKIGVWSETVEYQSGVLISKALGEFLGRFWLNIDTEGIYSDIVVEYVNKSSKSCQFNSNINKQWNPPYDFVISIGTELPSGTKKGISIGADSWSVFVNQNVQLSNDSNPVGPFCAAALASAEAVKVSFGKNNISDQNSLIPQTFSWNSWFGESDNPPENMDLYFDEMHIFGVGAVSHGFFWILKNWPRDITGTIHLIDPDNYDVSNAQRYLGMSADDCGKSKVKQMAEKLKRCHPNLDIKIYHKDMNQYFMDENSDCNVSLAIVGLDSIEGRRQLALKLPKNIINMWTSEDYVGASKHLYEDSWPCLYCSYPEEEQESVDETSLIFHELNKSLEPTKIRELLYSGQPLSFIDARKIGQKINIDFNSIIGKPIRSVRSYVCSTGRIQLPQSSTEAQVPFAFASGLAGLGGFVETVREIWKLKVQPGTWQMQVLERPTDYSWMPRKKRPNCYLCSDLCVKSIIQKKYG